MPTHWWKEISYHVVRKERKPSGRRKKASSQVFSGKAFTYALLLLLEVYRKCLTMALWCKQATVKVFIHHQGASYIADVEKISFRNTKTWTKQHRVQIWYLLQQVFQIHYNSRTFERTHSILTVHLPTAYTMDFRSTTMKCGEEKWWRVPRSALILQCKILFVHTWPTLVWTLFLVEEH